MLALTRRVNESIVITLPDARTILISVAKLGDDKVRLAFDAASDIAIDRFEVHHKRVAKILKGTNP